MISSNSVDARLKRWELLTRGFSPAAGRSGAQVDRQEHAGAAGGVAGVRSRGRVLEADVCELRHQNRRARARTRWEKLLGLQQLSAVQADARDAAGVALISLQERARWNLRRIELKI